MVKMMIDKGADVNAIDVQTPPASFDMSNWWENGGFRAIHLAARFGHPEVRCTDLDFLSFFLIWTFLSFFLIWTFFIFFDPDFCLFLIRTFVFF